MNFLKKTWEFFMGTKENPNPIPLKFVVLGIFASIFVAVYTQFSGNYMHDEIVSNTQYTFYTWVAIFIIATIYNNIRKKINK